MWYKRVAVLAVLWLGFRAELVAADSSPAASVDQAAEVLEHHERQGLGVAPDDITREFEWLERSHEALFDDTPIDRQFNRWRSRGNRLKAVTGLELGLAYTVLYQRLTDTRESHDPRQGAVGDLDIFGEWSPPGMAKERSGFLGFDVEYRSRVLTSSRPSDLGDSVGSLWGTTNDFDTQDVSLVQLWWQRVFANDAFSIRIGKIDQTDFFDVGSLKSADLFFTNFAFSENPAIASPDPGWGGAFQLDLNKGWYLFTGFGDANARRTTLAANDFFDHNDYFTAVEFGLTPTIAGVGKGHYQLMAWHTDGSHNHNEPDQPSGKGFALRFEQRIGGHVLPFATYSRASGGATDVRQLLTAGVGLKGAFGRNDGIFGAALAWGQPEDRSLRNQYVAELFYRIQLTQYIQLTPDFQLIAEPSRNRDNDTTGVLGLRMRIIL